MVQLHTNAIDGIFHICSFTWVLRFTYLVLDSPLF